ncbi:UDP-N-acetyl-alpha-D-glucosamine C6 dehydratase [compost metagenome]
MQTLRTSLLRLIAPVLDLLVVTVAYWLAFWLRFEGDVHVAHIHQFWLFFLAVPVLRVASNSVWGLYQHVWRYLGVREAMAVAMSTATGTFAFAFLLYLTSNASFPRSIVAIEAVLSLVLMGGSRFMLRYWHEMQPVSRPGDETRVLVIGAGDAGEMLVRDMLRQPERGLRPVGFLDDRPDKRGMRIHGVPVLGDRHAVAESVARHAVDLIVLAMPSAPAKEQRQILQLCAATPAKVQIVPSLHEIVTGEVSITHLRDIQIEDLLGRDPVVIDSSLLGYLEGKRVMVTGAGGSIGSELCRQIVTLGAESLIVLDHHEYAVYQIDQELRAVAPEGLTIVPVVADVRDEGRIRQVLAEHRPQLIFHAAAHKHVPLMEDSPAEAAHNNVLGTLAIATAALEAGVESVLLVSTDKAVRPSSVMGKTKRLAELALQDLAGRHPGRTKFLAVRFGNVLGSRGSVVPRFREQIAKGGPITVTHAEMTRYFMTIPEAVTLVLQTGALGRSGEVLMLDMGEPVRILDLARNMIKLSGLKEEDIEIVFTGMRPGEKLYEELLVTTEGTRPTEHPQVFAARSPNPPDPNWWSGVLAGLREAVSRHSDAAIRGLLEGAIAHDQARPGTQDLRAPHDLSSRAVPQEGPL